jgi:hypothetical protein
MVGDPNLPGVQGIIQRNKPKGTLSPEAFVDACLDLMGPLQAGTDTREELLTQAQDGGQLRWDTDAEVKTSTARVGEMLQLIVSMREFQFN